MLLNHQSAIVCEICLFNVHLLDSAFYVILYFFVSLCEFYCEIKYTIL